VTEEKERDQNRELEELRLLYQVSVSDIAAFKQQQWNITNYGLLLYAAIVAIPKLFNNNAALSYIEYFGLFLAAFVVLASGWFLLGMFATSIQHRRCRLTETRQEFTELFRKCWRGGKPESQITDRPDDKPSLLWFFRTVLGVGFITVSWLLFKFTCAT
jgi:hypothetical protein